MLVASLLNKENVRRPTVFQVANMPIVKKEIDAFIAEENCREELLEIIDFIEPPQDEDSDGLINDNFIDGMGQRIEEIKEVESKDL